MSKNICLPDYVLRCHWCESNIPHDQCALGFYEKDYYYLSVGQGIVPEPFWPPEDGYYLPEDYDPRKPFFCSSDTDSIEDDGWVLVEPPGPFLNKNEAKNPPPDL